MDKSEALHIQDVLSMHQLLMSRKAIWRETTYTHTQYMEKHFTQVGPLDLWKFCKSVHHHFS